jgi:hypothetical protein
MGFTKPSQECKKCEHYHGNFRNQKAKIAKYLEKALCRNLQPGTREIKI